MSSSESFSKLSTKTLMGGSNKNNNKTYHQPPMKEKL